MRTYIERSPQRPMLYPSMGRHYGKVSTRESHTHLDQSPRKHSIPGRLSGWHNDLSGKIGWPSPVDHEDLPLDRAPSVRYVHPVVLSQESLGHWATWLVSEMQSKQHWVPSRLSKGRTVALPGYQKMRRPPEVLKP